MNLIEQSGLFQPDWYAAAYPDVGMSGLYPLRHYILVGRLLGRQPNPLFSPPYYLVQTKDPAARENALVHYLTCGFRDRLSPHPLFDPRWYLGNYADVLYSGVEPLLHYLRHGGSEGRSPHPCFPATRVLQRCPHLLQSGRNPLEFYLSKEWAEDPCPEATFYLRALAEEGLSEPASTVAARISCQYRPARISRERQQDEGTPATDIRAIAIYLPQFHAIPENDGWWGNGFTEWTNVRRGKPIYEGHYQPHVPHPDIGYYDLNDETVLERQAAMARSACIEGFCFYYYWFNGKRLLNMPTDRMLASGKPDFPFCFCWANENWTRAWDGGDKEILIGQQHSPESDERFILDLIPAFRDPRYIRVNGRPLLVVYRPGLLPKPAAMVRRWRDICRREGIGEIFLARMQMLEGDLQGREIGFDAVIQFPPVGRGYSPDIKYSAKPSDPESFRGIVFDYRVAAANYAYADIGDSLWPGVCPSWDNTARRMERATSWLHASPETYHRWLATICAQARIALPAEERFVFINAWNEWAEGCHLEPDEKYGYAWLNATKSALAAKPSSGRLWECASLQLNPSVEYMRRNILQSLIGRPELGAQASWLTHYTALLSIFRQQGHTITAPNGTPICQVEGSAFALDARHQLRLVCDAVWGDVHSIPFCFVLLQHNQWAHTHKCVESIRNQASQKHPIHIIIVDNASSEESIAQTRKLFASSCDVSLIFNRKNLGFAGGNNVGYRHARDRFGDAFVVVMNNDVVLQEAGFIEQCSQIFGEWSYSVLGPNIVTPDGRQENPWNDYVYGVGGWKNLRHLFLRQREAYLASGLAEFRRHGEKSPGQKFIINPVLQGACYIFSPVYVHGHESPFDESSFLYGEEFPLAANCLLTGHLSLYSSTLSVIHEEGVTTAQVADRQKVMHGYDGALNGIALATIRLQRQRDACAGLPLDIDEEQISGLTSDGRRHVLVDLLFCQPGFHGGGEYGKAVFRGLIDAAVRLPDVQLWAALNPDLQIDPWVWEECRRFAINIVRVKSFDEVAALVNFGYFYSFFAPAIVVYTGYEYMKLVGGELKFSELSKTKVIGTLLDLRDLEIATAWEAIAETRRKAGCRLEADFTSEQWSEEKRRQSRLAEDLAGMYRRICSHKSLDTLVTISDYSAQSIRRHARHVGRIEVLFAPEKGRPAPQAFCWPGIDFESDPYLVVLNAGRREKNAVSAVAAFDLLFGEVASGPRNPNLKLVLVGIGSIDELGLNPREENARIMAIPPLPPAQLEHLLLHARGLLYPSFNEGFGYPPIEAMSLGVPCVVSETTSIPEVCGPAAIYCDPLSKESIAAAIKTLLENPPDTEKLKSQAIAIKARQNSDLATLVSIIFGVISEPISPGACSDRSKGALKGSLSPATRPFCAVL